MPQGQSWFDRIFSAPPSSQGLPALSQTPLEQTNPGLAKLRDLIGGFIGSQDALTPTSSGATLTGAAMASLIPLAGVLKMGQGEQAAVKGIKAYHGSPHDFDKFSMQKIGTGEGAQAYGHGLYFAENPQVAADYRKSLSSPSADNPIWRLRGEPVAPGTDQYQLAAALELAGRQKKGESIEEFLRRGADRLEDHGAFVDRTYGGDPGNMYRAHAARLRAVDPKDLTQHQPGKTYEVAIKADPDEFLHWDKPIADHPVAQKIVAESKRSGLGYTRSPSGYGDDNEFKSLVKWEPDAKSDWNTIQDLRTKWLTLNKTYQTSGYKKEHQAASEAAYEAYSTFLDRQQQTTGKWVLRPDATGADFYKTLVASHGMDPQAATEMLRKAGIKGIKYLDQGSRSAYAPNIQVLKDRVTDRQGALKVFQDRLAKPSSERMRLSLEADAAKAKRDLESAQLHLEVAERQPPVTHNYVVFDDQLIDIMKKYGVALPVAATIKAWRESQQPKAKGS